MTLQLFRKKEKEIKKEKKETERKIERVRVEIKDILWFVEKERKKENVGRKKGLQIATSLQHGYAVMKTATILHAR
jgi:hypothetical protein